MTPPGLAMWLLKPFTPAGGDDAFIGDLHELFAGGQSRAWFWRQVIGAIGLAVARSVEDRRRGVAWITLTSVSLILIAILPPAQSNWLLRTWAAVYVTAGFTAVLLGLAPARPLRVAP